jgi:hypothetical protein
MPVLEPQYTQMLFIANLREIPDKASQHTLAFARARVDCPDKLLTPPTDGFPYLSRESGYDCQEKQELPANADVYSTMI